MQAGERSHWHWVDADEIWLWHAGAPLVLSMGVDQAGEVRLGPDVLGGEVVQAVRRAPCLADGALPPAARGAWADEGRVKVTAEGYAAFTTGYLERRLR